MWFRLSFALIAACAAYSAGAALAQDVTIYRCVGADGRLTLRDSPCEKGETQQTRTMQRPKDPPPRAELPTPAATSVSTPREPPTRVVYATPPRPMYECITPEGERYTSDSDEGNPRWQPFWTPVYPAYPVWPHGGGASVSGNLSIGNGNLSFSSGSPTPLPPRPPHPGHPGPRPPGQGVVLPAGGTWIRDRCHPLPQQEVCARLSDRRYEILRRYGSAMPSERRELDLEQRGIDARIANDCVD
ncbi:DUF4124 domain-containing protein [Pseudoxanthomonas sp. UTMC 1351]|uniref:DUF4124 domain-containing protein n=1 Tax=Pseudoxanthomonas sp. UTMC 1351 TaxID=2695853 RepID=UPI0034CE3C6C